MKNNITEKKPESKRFTGCVMFSDGNYLFGEGFGAEGTALGELCFNTSMTGYQEILTDLSYAGQIINFTFPHIGNTGTNDKDNESFSPVAMGMLTRNMPTDSSHWQSKSDFNNWLIKNKVIGIGNIDSRKVTRLLRSGGAQMVAICHSQSGNINANLLKKIVGRADGLEGKELTAAVTCSKSFSWKTKRPRSTQKCQTTEISPSKPKIVAIDFGAKWAIFERLTSTESIVQVVPAATPFETILQQNPDGIFLSNGPGDPLATFKRFGKTIVKLLTETEIPIFGICLGHQILGLAAGANTIKMSFGHHGANHPVIELKTGKVEITSMNHGFALDQQSLPHNLIESHVSLFDNSNCGIEIPQRNCFSVQHHPEASPGPRDSYYLFEKFFQNATSYAKTKKSMDQISRKS